MTIQEKTKAYDEAIERARKELQTCGSVNCDAAKQIFRLFPELKESEDERIRKELIDFVKSRLAGFPECDRFIAWLEKQDTFSKKDVDNAYLKGITDAKNEIEKQHEIIFPKLKEGELTWLTRYIEEKVYSLSMDIRDDEDRIKLKNLKKSLNWLEKQGEKPQGKLALEAIKEEKVDNQNCVKPTDKVKPKFNVGDWVIHGCNILKIRCVGNEYYCIGTVGGYADNMLISEIDSLYHLWTIQDAKNGDVLFHSDSASNGIFIFKEIVQHGDIQEVTCYCDYDSEDGFCLGEYYTCCWVDSKILHPATKGRRELLFEKMKEVGYEWDADNKELKKVGC